MSFPFNSNNNNRESIDGVVPEGHPLMPLNNPEQQGATSPETSVPPPANFGIKLKWHLKNQEQKNTNDLVSWSLIRQQKVL